MVMMVMMIHQLKLFAGYLAADSAVASQAWASGYQMLFAHLCWIMLLQ